MIEILTSNYAQVVLSQIHAASTSIDVLAYVIKFNPWRRSDRANLIIDALKRFNDATHSVRVIMDYPRKYKPNYHTNLFSSRRLKEAGIKTRFFSAGKAQHAKLFLFDGALAIAGSHNLTPSSVTNNLDISFLTNDWPVLQTLQQHFDKLWAEATEA